MSRKYVPWCAQRTHTVQARTTFVAAGTPAGPTHKSPAVLDNLPLLSEDTTQIFFGPLESGFDPAETGFGPLESGFDPLESGFDPLESGLPL